jgi:predicted RNase H-like nuclease (RuvC/YqgF family)
MIDRYLKNVTKILYPFLLISFSLLLFFFILPQVSTKFAMVAGSFERIDTDKKAILTALEKKLKQDSVRVSDTVFFNLKWEELLKKNDSLQFQLSSESLKENLRLNKTELDLRKKESLLLIRISAGDSTQVKALKKVQQQLSELNSTSQ